MAGLKSCQNWIFLTLGIAASLGSVVGLRGGDSTSWDRTQVDSTQGDAITLTCTAQNVGPFEVVRLSHRFPDGTEHTIAENSRLKPDYRNSGRYHLQYSEEDDDSVILSLENTGVRGEDRGRFGCYKRVEVGEPDVVYATINVLVPVEEVYVVAVEGPVGEEREQKIGDGETVTLKQRKRTGVKCVAKIDGSDTPPELGVKVGGMDQAGLFSDPSESNSMTGSRSSILDKLTGRVELEYITFDPLPAFNEQELTCEATSPGLATVTATVMLDVTHAPIIECPKYEFYAQEGSSVEITCQVTANPSSRLVWYSGTSPETRTEVADDNDHFLTREKPLSQSKAEVTLVITDINAGHFTQYYINAINELGEDDIVLKLEEAAEAPTKPTLPPQPSNSQKNPNSQDQNEQKPAEPQTVVGDNGASSCLSVQLPLLVSVLVTLHHLLWKTQ